MRIERWKKLGAKRGQCRANFFNIQTIWLIDKMSPRPTVVAPSNFYTLQFVLILFRSSYPTIAIATAIAPSLLHYLTYFDIEMCRRVLLPATSVCLSRWSKKKKKLRKITFAFKASQILAVRVAQRYLKCKSYYWESVCSDPDTAVVFVNLHT